MTDHCPDLASEECDILALTRYLREPSRICDSGNHACAKAKAWLAALDRSRSFKTGAWSPPMWLRDTYQWGPIQWPIAWRDLPNADVLDCGAFAALTEFLFSARGLDVLRVQLVLRYPTESVEGWKREWDRAGANSAWTRRSLCYHEAIAVEEPGEAAATTVRVWDPTDCLWVEPDWVGNLGVASVTAIRVAGTRVAQPIHWGGHALTRGVWHVF